MNWLLVPTGEIRGQLPCGDQSVYKLGDLADGRLEDDDCVRGHHLPEPVHHLPEVGEVLQLAPQPVRLRVQQHRLHGLGRHVLTVCHVILGPAAHILEGGRLQGEQESMFSTGEGRRYVCK